VLDLACGTGIVARLTAPLVGVHGRVAAVDINPGMLAAGQAQPPPGGAPIEWHHGDAARLDFPDETFDLVLCQQGVQFFSDRKAALQQVNRVLKHGGRIAIKTWRAIEEHPLYHAQASAETRHLEPLNVDGSSVFAPFSLHDSEELTRLFQESGYAEIQVTKHSQEVRFPSPDSFVANSEFAYAAVIPQFVENPAAFEVYVEKVKEELHPLLEQYQVGEELIFPMHAHIVTAYKR